MSNPQVNQQEQDTVRTIGCVNSLAGAVTEVVVHIDGELDEEQREEFEQEMRSRRGILDLSFCPNRHHLMIVQYQPALLSSGQLIEQVRRLTGQAQLIGPI
ncbi:MAG: hypothetical protein PVJ66_01420 [Gammaproteobacteria bacterium]|jgi:hypothetical protein